MNLIERDLAHIWHPCTQMKDHEAFPPIAIASASGIYLERPDGQRIIDAISSWWCKSLGHNHPHIREALIAQAHRFEHIIGADTCSDIQVALSDKLTALNPALTRVFYAGDGASSVEIAIKMAIQAQQLRGQPQRTQLMALENGYHGESVLTMALSDLGQFKQPFESLLPHAHILRGIPYSHSIENNFNISADDNWAFLEAQLAAHASTLAALIVEPLVQGSGGMLMYPASLLQKLRAWCDHHNVYLIHDEIMTGIGRTGTALAGEHANVTPDFVCLSKGLTSGWLAMSCVITKDEIYHLFYDDYRHGKTFMHSNTFSGNALACACANATLEVIAREGIYAHVQRESAYLKAQMEIVAKKTGALKNVRACGFIVAADLINPKPRAGYALFKQAVELGAWLRPLGNTVYWLPPLIMTRDEIDALRDITLAALETYSP